MNNYDPNYVSQKVLFQVGQKAIILNDEQQILLLRRSSKVDSSGKWNLPGGRLEEGEDPYDAIKREIVEETQIEVSNIEIFTLTSLKNEDNTIIICYKAKNPSAEVKINWEHDEYKWVTAKEALSMDITDVTRDFVTKYER